MRFAHALILPRGGQRMGCDGWRPQRSPEPVSDIRVSSNAGEWLGGTVSRARRRGTERRPGRRRRVRDGARTVVDRVRDLLVTVATRILRHAPVSLRDAKRIGIVAGREV